MQMSFSRNPTMYFVQKYIGAFILVVFATFYFGNAVISYIHCNRVTHMEMGDDLNMRNEFCTDPENKVKYGSYYKEMCTKANERTALSPELQSLSCAYHSLHPCGSQPCEVLVNRWTGGWIPSYLVLAFIAFMSSFVLKPLLWNAMMSPVKKYKKYKENKQRKQLQKMYQNLDWDTLPSTTDDVYAQEQEMARVMDAQRLAYESGSVPVKRSSARVEMLN